MEIFSKKESSANVNRDGPSSKYEANKVRLDHLKNLHLLAMERNGVNIGKQRGKYFHSKLRL